MSSCEHYSYKCIYIKSFTIRHTLCVSTQCEHSELLTAHKCSSTKTIRLQRAFFLYIVLHAFKEFCVEPEKVKPIMVRPTPELRRKIEREAKQQKRSMGNLLLIIITKAFHQQDINTRPTE